MIGFNGFSVRECVTTDFGFGVHTWRVPSMPMYAYLDGTSRLLPEVHVASKISAADVLAIVKEFATKAAAANPLHSINVFVRDSDVNESRSADPSNNVWWITVTIVLSKPANVLVTTDGTNFVRL